MADILREFTADELRQYNGQNGMPVYIAYEGRVYDVTESKMWKTGTHMKKHTAGADLTREIAEAPHDTDVLERFEQVGLVAGEAPAEVEPDYDHLPGFVGWLLKRVPFLERHPHPMTVHFPIVLNIAAPAFLLMYMLTGNAVFEITAFHVLAGAVLFSLVAIPTGYLTWWINYLARPMKAVTAKIVASAVLFVVGAVALVLRWMDPEIASELSGTGLLYAILVFSLFPIISVIGWLGAGLTFPLPTRRTSTVSAETPPGTSDAT